MGERGDILIIYRWWWRGYILTIYSDDREDIYCSYIAIVERRYVDGASCGLNHL
jgi:hypothetical protein